MGAKNGRGRITVLELAIVRAVCGRLRREQGGRVDLDDLISLGNELLVEAEIVFDPSRSPSFRTFASNYVLFRLRDALRAMRRRPTEAAALAAQSAYCHAGASGHLDARLESDAAHAELLRAIEALDPADAVVIRAFYLEGRPLGAIALDLGIAYPTVLQRRARAFGRLQQLMGAGAEGPAKILKWRRTPRTTRTDSLGSTPSPTCPSSSTQETTSGSATGSNASWRRAG